MAASEWVRRHLRHLTSGQKVLDVACGSGRHLALAAALGLRATGVDREVGAARELAASLSGAQIRLVEADLEDGSAWPLGAETFDAVVVTNYLWRPILPDIVGSVGPAGLLVYETFAAGHAALGRPRNPDFLLQPGELIEAVAGRLVPIAFDHVRLSDPERIVQRIAAVSPDHDWLRAPPSV